MPKPSLGNPVGRVRVVAMAEAVSFLLLLGIAMPLKYFADMPLAVRYVGMIHGVLFVLLMLVLVVAWLLKCLPFKHALLMVLASLIPFGPFLIDRRIAGDESGD